MAKRIALNVSLTSELAGFVRTQVASGAYGSASEVIRAGLRLLVAASAPHGEQHQASGTDKHV